MARRRAGKYKLACLSATVLVLFFPLCVLQLSSDHGAEDEMRESHALVKLSHMEPAAAVATAALSPKPPGSSILPLAPDDSALLPGVIEDPSRPYGRSPTACLQKEFRMDFPMSELEQELRRVYAVVDTVMRKHGITYWPADGTLLGIIRQGRVANDLDLDFHVLTTRKDCLPLLRSLEGPFKKMATILRFSIAVGGKKHRPYTGVAMFAMVRMVRQFGDINTGADITCVYYEPDGLYTVFNHFGRLMPIPNNTFPLVPCRVYDMTVMCPADGHAMLKAFKPRYDGCMIFPHCFGDPERSHRRCLTPHPPVPLADFVNATKALQRCGYANLVDHYGSEPLCARLMEEAERPGLVCCDPTRCELLNGHRYCFLQPFNG
ncbi:hypothetical protein DQ04_01921050 [Trypanosoma grayi]|uniref:hypothetical protein n=1 Tax=Trypanosoma grayi TaxID=71804 RepID=UPI0004F47D4E|nr:hypothetical protein DQ04_01921050 [Trypanosoma grayi]KEG12182.1 hypothetical protein DQ04_01921050 [Trypanosoma grayi]